MQFKEKLQKYWLDISYLPLVISAVITIVITYFVYAQTQDILKERLRERLTAIAATAVLGIDAQDITTLQTMEKIDSDKALNSTELIRVVDHLGRVRDANSSITYIYVWSKTDDPNIVTFTADAEMIDPFDLNGNGEIDGIEIPPAPGEEYDVTEVELIQEAFSGPAMAQNEFIIDKWGTFLTGFAPVIDADGNVVAILGIDVEVSDFNTLVRATLIPFIVLAVILLAMLTIETASLIRIWRNRVDIVKEIDQQKDELLGIVSHQLATPVSSLKWYIEMLLDGDMGQLSKEQEGHIKTLQGVAVNLSDLVSMILDVSRIQLGKMKVDRTKINLNEFFNEIISMVEPKAIDKNLKFNKSIPDNIPIGNLDKRLMRMTFENLLTNAIKYTPENGEVDLVINCSEEILSYSVKDNGCGIPKGDQDKIFGKLYRASNVRKIDGNGFGLYAAQGAVEAQGGKISFDSTEGKGTTFYVEIPLDEKG